MNLLFICVENSCRSQMAEAYVRMSGPQGVQAFSAGSRPSGGVHPKAIAAMSELGYDMSGHTSKSLEAVEAHGPFDALVSMGCEDTCPWVTARVRRDWDLPDPKHMGRPDFNRVRDEIGRLVAALWSDPELHGNPGESGAESHVPAHGDGR